MPAAPSPVAVQAQRWRPTAALSRGRSLNACALLRGMGVGVRLGPPMPPRKPSPPRRPPRQQPRALALIWYRLLLGQSPDASAQVTPVPPCRSDHPPGTLAAGGSTRPTPGDGPDALPPGSVAQSRSRGPHGSLRHPPKGSSAPQCRPFPCRKSRAVARTNQPALQQSPATADRAIHARF